SGRLAGSRSSRDLALLFPQHIAQFIGTGGGGPQRPLEQLANAAVLQDLERRLGGAARRGHLAAQGGGAVAAFQRHLGGAQRGLLGQQPRGVWRQSEPGGGGLEQLDQQEEIGRPAAGDGGDGVHQPLVVQPAGDPGGAQQRFGKAALLGGYPGIGVQRGG